MLNLTPKNPSNIFYVVLLILCIVVGFVLGRYGFSMRVPVPSSSTAEKVTIFDSQTAALGGEITSINGDQVTVKNNQGETKSFPISKKLVIYKFAAGSRSASGSADVKSIEQSKKASLVFEVEDNQYKLTSVTYLPSN